jgi:hypothetical protein
VAAWTAARLRSEAPRASYFPGEDPFTEAILRGHLAAAWRDGPGPRRTRHLRRRIEHDESVRAVRGIAIGVALGLAFWAGLALLIWQVTR